MTVRDRQIDEVMRRLDRHVDQSIREGGSAGVNDILFVNLWKRVKRLEKLSKKERHATDTSSGTRRREAP